MMRSKTICRVFLGTLDWPRGKLQAELVLEDRPHTSSLGVRESGLTTALQGCDGVPIASKWPDGDAMSGWGPDRPSSILR